MGDKICNGQRLSDSYFESCTTFSLCSQAKTSLKHHKTWLLHFFTSSFNTTFTFFFPLSVFCKIVFSPFLRCYFFLPSTFRIFYFLVLMYLFPIDIMLFCVFRLHFLPLHVLLLYLFFLQILLSANSFAFIASCQLQSRFHFSFLIFFRFYASVLLNYISFTSYFLPIHC